ncbi:MAG: acyl-CoA dehydrogenase family protein [Novosphingobium sp.]
MIELSELQDAAQKAFPADQLRPSRDESWRLIAEMGWLMIRVPEDAGGLGLGRDASTAILVELGRVLSSAPVIPALLAIEAFVASEMLADREDWLGRAMSGEYIAVSLGAGSSVQVDGDTLSGTLPAVPDADMASHVLVLAPSLAVLVPPGAAGVTLTARPMWDESRRLFDVTLEAHAVNPALVLARGAAADAIAAHVLAEMQLALAADSLGGANAALEMTVEYLKTRRQFERPLAMFQALKHRCADLKVQIGAAEALLHARAGAGEASLTELGALKALASDVYRVTTEEAIQLHGGIGLTDEHNCHLFMKRAFLNLQLGGSADRWRERAGREAMVTAAAG